MKKVILFDLDGTLTDSRSGILNSLRYALDYFGLEYGDESQLMGFIGPPLRESFRKMYRLNESDTEVAVGKFREYFADKGIFENTMYTGVSQLLENLTSQGKILLLATSKVDVYAEKILRHFGIFNHFTFISGSQMDGSRSDKAELIRFALEMTGLNASCDAVMVGDRKHDILGAKATGLASVGVLYGYGSRSELVEAEADTLVESVGELNELLGVC